MIVTRGFINVTRLTRLTGDLVYTILGCRDLIALQPTTAGGLKLSVAVICTAYLMQMGPLPVPWKLRSKPDDLGLCISYFHNSITGEDSKDDPRLGPIVPGCEHFEADRPVTMQTILLGL